MTPESGNGDGRQAIAKAPVSRFQLILRALFSLLLALSLTLAGWFAFRTIEEGQQQSSCNSNLHMIAILLQTYHDVYETLAPARVVDSRGTPMHSWRTLILSMYNPRFPPPYKLNEPWDGPYNGKFTSSWKSDFVCPAAGHSYPTPVTDYAMVVGPGTASPGNASVSFDEFADGRENTVIIIELPQSDIRWGEPRDVTIEEAIAILGGAPSKKKLAGQHGGRLALLFADGEIRRLNRPLPDEAARGLLTIAGGERVTRDELSAAGYF